MLTDGDEVVLMWEEYVLKSFDDIRGDATEVRGDIKVLGKVRQKVKEIENDVVDGVDRVVTNMHVAATGEFGNEKIIELTNRMYDTGDIPEKIMENIFIAISKKSDTVECKEHRTITLMSQVGK